MNRGTDLDHHLPCNVLSFLRFLSAYYYYYTYNRH